MAIYRCSVLYLQLLYSTTGSGTVCLGRHLVPSHRRHLESGEVLVSAQFRPRKLPQTQNLLPLELTSPSSGTISFPSTSFAYWRWSELQPERITVSPIASYCRCGTISPVSYQSCWDSPRHYAGLVLALFPDFADMERMTMPFSPFGKRYRFVRISPLPWQTSLGFLLFYGWPFIDHLQGCAISRLQHHLQHQEC